MDILNSSFLDSCHRLEVFEEFLFALRSKTVNPIKFGAETIFTTNLTVEGDSKTVNFILDTVKEEKFLGLTWQINDLQRVPKEQFVGLVLVIFLKPRNWDREIQFITQDILGHINLPLTTIHDNKVW